VFHLIDRVSQRQAFATLEPLTDAVGNRAWVGLDFTPEPPDTPARIRWGVLDDHDLGVEDAGLDAALAARIDAGRQLRRLPVPALTLERRQAILAPLLREICED